MGGDVKEEVFFNRPIEKEIKKFLKSRGMSSGSYKMVQLLGDIEAHYYSVVLEFFKELNTEKYSSFDYKDILDELLEELKLEELKKDNRLLAYFIAVLLIAISVVCFCLAVKFTILPLLAVGVAFAIASLLSFLGGAYRDGMEIQDEASILYSIVERMQEVAKDYALLVQGKKMAVDVSPGQAKNLGRFGSFSSEIFGLKGISDGELKVQATEERAATLNS